MSTRTISITDEAYERLKAKKEGKESFSDVILKMTGKRKITDFVGILTEKEASEMEARIKESRSRSRARMDNIRKRLNE